MGKKANILALAAFSSLLLTGCSAEKGKAINSIEENVISAIANDENIKKDFSGAENLNYNFTGYEVFDTSANPTLNVFGKLFNDAAKSYLKLSYDAVDFSKYNFEGEVDAYKSIASIVSDYDYKMDNVAVYDYNNFEKVFGSAVPEKDSNGHNLNAYEVLSVDNLSYNADTNQMEFNSNVLADYKWTTTATTIVLAGKTPVPITHVYTHHNYETYSYDVKYNMLEEDYNNYKNDTKALLNLLEQYAELGLTSNYSMSDSSKLINTKLAKNTQTTSEVAEEPNMQ